MGLGLGLGLGLVVGGGGNLAAYAPLAQHNDAGGFRAHAAGLGFWVMVRKTFGTTGAERAIYLRRGGCIVWLSVLALASSTG